MAYDFGEHRHRFAVWTAARAVARAFTGTATVKRAIETSSLPQLILSDPAVWPKQSSDVDELHREWGRTILEELSRDSAVASYGRAAKVIAVYLKTAVILPFPASDFARLAHPPLDGILLAGLGRDPALPVRERAAWRATRWTKLSEDQYFELISSLRRAGLDEPSFWHLERYWQPDRDGALP